MILADSSAWIEFDKATGSSVDRRMTALVAADGGLTVTEPVMMEVLAGARDEARAEDLRRLLLRFRLLSFDAVADFESAAHIYRRCRRAGITPRGMIDCMVAAVAWRCGAALLSYDRDLDHVARVIGIRQDGASLQS